MKTLIVNENGTHLPPAGSGFAFDVKRTQVATNPRGELVLVVTVEGAAKPLKPTIAGGLGKAR